MSVKLNSKIVTYEVVESGPNKDSGPNSDLRKIEPKNSTTSRSADVAGSTPQQTSIVPEVASPDSQSGTQPDIQTDIQLGIAVEPLGGDEQLPANVVQMHEKVERPDMLVGSTYKIKTPLSEHALYVTINDILLNPGTPYEKRRPFEIFINSKNMDHFQWIVALTRIVSAVFRKGGDVTFLVEELRSVFDPKGGYFKSGGKYMPSLVAEIGDAIETHMKMIGMIVDDGLEPHQQKLVDEKRKEYQQRIEDNQGGANAADAEVTSDSAAQSGFPAEAQLCAKCHTKATVMMDGCMTCLNCGDSKCG